MTTQEIMALASEKSGICDVTDDNSEGLLSVKTEDGCIAVFSDREANLTIYSADGRAVRSVRVYPSENRIDGLAQGFYIVGRHKIILK